MKSNRHPFIAFRNLACLAALLFATSCAPLEKAAPPVASLTLPKNSDRKRLEEGRQIYATSCTHCHGPARIDRRSDENWTRKILPKMCEKAMLTADQSEALKQYVLTARRALGVPLVN